MCEEVLSQPTDVTSHDGEGHGELAATINSNCVLVPASRVGALGAGVSASVDGILLAHETLIDHADRPPELFWAIADPRRVALTGGVGGWGTPPYMAIATSGLQAVRCGGDGYAPVVGSPAMSVGAHVITFTIDSSRANSANILLGVTDARLTHAAIDPKAPGPPPNGTSHPSSLPVGDTPHSPW